MQCKKCGSEWKTNARASLIIKCPFCGAELDNKDEDRLTFDNAKEALRYIIKTYGIDIMLDGLQLRSLLDEFIPDLKQERKVFLDAYEQGVCNALYMAHDEPEIDKCIAILQSIKVLTQDACMAEKWACYVVETLVYALNWNVPMFGITPNIHMYQIPENIREKDGKIFIDSGDVWEGDSSNENEALPPEKSQLPETTGAPRPAVFDFFSNSQAVEETSEEKQEETKIESPVFDFTGEEEEKKKETKIEPPVFDFTGEEEEKKEETKIEPPVFDFTGEEEEKKEETKIEPPVFDFTGEEEEKKEPEKDEPKKDEKPAAAQNPWGQMPQGADPSQQPQMPWGYNPWMQMPQGADPSQQPQMPWGYNPWMQQMPNNPNQPVTSQPPVQADKKTEEKPSEPEAKEEKTETPPVAEDKKPENEVPVQQISEPEKPEETKESDDEPEQENTNTVPENLVTFTAADVPNSKQVTVPGNYQAIDDAAFSGRDLESVNLPEGLIKIGDRAFENCSKLMTINIPSTVVEIGRSAFAGCKSLRKIELNDNIKRIRQSTFSNCENLANFVIPKSVQSFGKHAFLNCESITEMDIPDGVEELPENLFSGCRSLVKVRVPESVCDIRKNVFSWCEALTTVNIPESVTEIGDGAFTGCSSLRTVNIPQNLISIGYGSFSKCGNLRSLILPDTISNISANAFNGSNRTLVVRCSADNKYVKHYCRMNRVKCKDIETEE